MALIQVLLEANLWEKMADRNELFDPSTFITVSHASLMPQDPFAVPPVNFVLIKTLFQVSVLD